MLGYNTLYVVLLFLLGDRAFGDKPTEVSLVCDKASGDGENDNIYIGQKDVVRLVIKFPDGITTDVKVELLPSTTDTIFALGGMLDCTEGGALTSIENSDWYENGVLHKGKEYAKGNHKISYYTRASFDIGDVNNDGDSEYEEDSYITILYEIVYVSIGSYSDNQQYWVSCGMAYNGHSHIWISQYSYNLKQQLNDDFTGTSDFSVASVSEMEAGGKLTTTDLTLKISKARASVKVAVLVLTETSDLAPVKMEMVWVGEAYSYSFNTDLFVADTLDDCHVRQSSQQSLELDLGTIVNKESQVDEADPIDNEIVITVHWLVFNDSAVGNEYILGVGMDVDEVEIAVASFNVTIVERSDPATALKRFNTLALTTIEAGGVGIVSLNIDVPPESFHEYVMTLSSKKNDSDTSKLSILSYSFEEKGLNIPCEFENVELYKEKTDETNPDVVNKANMTFSILNHGLNITNSTDSKIPPNSYRLKISFMMLLTASEGDGYELSVVINGVERKPTVRVRGVKGYDENIAYAFTSYIPEGTRIFTGAQFNMELEVATARNTKPGPMTIEVPIPVDVPYLKLVKAWTISKGANVVCPPSGILPQVDSDCNATLGDGARSVLTIDMVCNIQSVDDVEDDKWKIMFTLQVLDHKDLVTASDITTIEVGTGVNFSGNQIYVGGETFHIIEPKDLSDLKVVTGVTLNDAVPPSEWPGDYELQWSVDGTAYLSHQLGWKDVTSLTQRSFVLKKPLLARYVRLTTPAAPGSPAYNFTVDGDTQPSINLLGANTTVAKLKPKLMYAMDGDEDTCMPLPMKNDTDVPQYFMAQFPTILLTDLGLADSVDLTSNFTLTLVGEGIQCNSTFQGPQRTVVYNPADTLKAPFHGSLSKCHNTHGNSTLGSKMMCQYACTCNSLDTCGAVILVLVHDDLPPGRYSLCDLRID